MKVNLIDVLTKAPTEPDWLLPGFLHKSQIICIAGAPGVGKSMLGYYIAMCLSSKTPFYGPECVSGTTLYFDEENSKPDSEQYLRWLWNGMKQPPANILNSNFCLEHFSLGDQGKNRWGYMKERAKDFHPDLIIIDTASPVCNIQQENDNSEAITAMKNLRSIRATAGKDTALIIFKHVLFSHDGLRTIRGAKAWLDLADGVLYHVVKAGRPPLNGLRTTFVCPDKTRAFGLKQDLKIFPAWGTNIGPGGLPDSIIISIS